MHLQQDTDNHVKPAESHYTSHFYFVSIISTLQSAIIWKNQVLSKKEITYVL